MAAAAVGGTPPSLKTLTLLLFPLMLLPPPLRVALLLPPPLLYPRRHPDGRPPSPVSLGGAGLAVAAVASAFAFPSAAAAAAADLLRFSSREPGNALSLPTWAIHVSSVVEWVTAMALVWEYGDKSGFESWKGLSWGCLFMQVPLLGGAMCACTWHFFYNSESLESLVALQAALTVIGNLTMCIAAFRIYKSSQGGSEKS